MRLGMAALLWGFLVFPLSASMVSFMVIETGLRPEANKSDYSYAWEDGLMSVFFDEGHIVSNSLVLRMEKTPEGIFPKEAEEDFLEAYRGGADYFILILLEYKSQGVPLRPQGALIKIFTTEESSEPSQNLVYEQQFPVGTGVNVRDEYVRAQETGKIVAAQLKDRF